MAAKPLADLIDDLLAPALAAQGFAGRAIVSLWPEIVGERLAARTRPLKIDWPRRRPAPGEAPSRRRWWCGSRAPLRSRCSISRRS